MSVRKRKEKRNKKMMDLVVVNFGEQYGVVNADIEKREVIYFGTEDDCKSYIKVVEMMTK